MRIPSAGTRRLSSSSSKVRRLICLLLGAGVTTPALADWPMLRGEPSHRGFVQGQLKPPFRLAWAAEFENERLGTAMEPIVAGGKVFVATHQGNLYALDTASGKPVWRVDARAPFLQSPAVGVLKDECKMVVAGTADGKLFAVAAETGKQLWENEPDRAGFSAAPAIAGGTVFIGTRGGIFIAVSLETGKERWRGHLGVPIRQSAAVEDGRVFVTGEDLRLRCFSAPDGKELWVSEPFPGQTARDYYPVVVRHGGRTYVIVRTNPTLNMGQRIGRDRTLLCRNAGVDDSSWQKLDAWIKGPSARGTPELWAQEQAAVREFLSRDPDARSFFVMDAETGRETATTPILWIAGCQGVGAQPAQMPDGDLLVFYRSAYGNWNHGVAPLVALGKYDLAENKVSPLFHKQGAQPPWNTFWGTADESQNFLVVGNTVLIIHQGTLSGFDLESNDLFPVWGERDTYGGFKNPGWARNEWHGPGRSGVAVSEGKIYWQTGSRILCLEQGNPGARPKPISVANVPASSTLEASQPASREQLRNSLNALALEIASKNWSPLFCDPGLAGRTFAFDQSGEFFEAVAWAWPYLQAAERDALTVVAKETWERYAPWSSAAWYPLVEGQPRERFGVPPAYRARLGTDRQPHPFGNTRAIWLYAERCGEQKLVLRSWDKLKATYEDFRKSGWTLDGNKGNSFANRYLASMEAMVKLADLAGDEAVKQLAEAQAASTRDALIAWWKRAAQTGTLGTFQSSSELDPFIGKGDGISFAVAPHRHKLALFQDLTPEIAAVLNQKCPEEVRQVWSTFKSLCPTWQYQGEERQVHYGENFVDPPDFALSAFRAATWLQMENLAGLGRLVDQPFCRADLYHFMKTALALERMASE